MKKTIIILFTALMPVLAGAQAQINTKKIKIADFPEKVTKVVLNGNDFIDLSLQEEVAARWRVSPYEFCTLEEFEELKTDDSYYFLISTKNQFRRESEPGVQFLSLLKGGKEAENGIGEMLEVTVVPVAAAENSTGREFVFLPAFLDIIQRHALESIEKDIIGYSGLAHYTEDLKNIRDKRVVFADSDLSPEMAAEEKYFSERIVVMEEDEADELFAEGTPGTVVSISVSPSDSANGYCYKMLIDAETHELYYYRRHRITKKTGTGFIDEDMKKISSKK